MNPLATIRQGKIPWVRRMLGVFVVVWLNMALQPCAMAFGAADAMACPYCPPVHAAEGPEHSAHEMNHMDVEASPCESSPSQCNFLDDFKYGGKTVKVKLEDAWSDVPIGIAPSLVVVPRAIQLAAILDLSDSVQPFVDPSPLNLLYCVYLI